MSHRPQTTPELQAVVNHLNETAMADWAYSSADTTASDLGRGHAWLREELQARVQEAAEAYAAGEEPTLGTIRGPAPDTPQEDLP